MAHDTVPMESSIYSIAYLEGSDPVRPRLRSRQCDNQRYAQHPPNPRAPPPSPAERHHRTNHRRRMIRVEEPKGKAQHATANKLHYYYLSESILRNSPCCFRILFSLWDRQHFSIGNVFSRNVNTQSIKDTVGNLPFD